MECWVQVDPPMHLSVNAPSLYLYLVMTSAFALQKLQF